MTLPFIILGAFTAGSAIAAMALRNLVHCALCLVLTFVGLAALYLQLDAEFVGLVQILVYIGAVSILLVFAILLTRGTDPASPASFTTATPWAISIAVAVLLVMLGAMQESPSVRRETPEPAAGAAAQTVSVPVKALGLRLMEEYVVPLEVLGLLLTAAMIGATIIALPERVGEGGRR